MKALIGSSTRHHIRFVNNWLFQSLFQANDLFFFFFRSHLGFPAALVLTRFSIWRSFVCQSIELHQIDFSAESHYSPFASSCRSCSHSCTFSPHWPALTRSTDFKHTHTHILHTHASHHLLSSSISVALFFRPVSRTRPDFESTPRITSSIVCEQAAWHPASDELVALTHPNQVDLLQPACPASVPIFYFTTRSWVRVLVNSCTNQPTTLHHLPLLPLSLSLFSSSHCRPAYSCLAHFLFVYFHLARQINRQLWTLVIVSNRPRLNRLLTFISNTPINSIQIPFLVRFKTFIINSFTKSKVTLKVRSCSNFYDHHVSHSVFISRTRRSHFGDGRNYFGRQSSNHNRTHTSIR